MSFRTPTVPPPSPPQVFDAFLYSSSILPHPFPPQVFDAFLHSFTTYRSMLMRIKYEYDAALDDALASVYDNVHMRSELASSEETMVSGGGALDHFASQLLRSPL